MQAYVHLHLSAYTSYEKLNLKKYKFKVTKKIKKKIKTISAKIIIYDENNINTKIKISIRDTDNYFIQAISSIDNKCAISWSFAREQIKFMQQIITSSCTYFGMKEVLMNLEKYTKEQYNNILPQNTICVLCPVYCVNLENGYGGDTQACGGGKLVQKYDHLGRIYTESFEDAASCELLEELRIIGNNGHMASRFKTISLCPKNNLEQTIMENDTEIFIYHISNCSLAYNFNPIIHNKSRGIDILSKRAGYVVWGTISECLRLFSNFVQNKNILYKDDISPLVDNIEAISIVPLEIAIQMVDSASKHLKGDIIEKWVF